MHHLRQLIACLLLVLCLPQAALAQNAAPTVAEIIAGDDRFTVLERMLDLADPEISAYLSHPEAQVTFFAPTNAAMEAMFGETHAQQQVYADTYPYRVNEIIRFHIIPAAVDFTLVTYPACRGIGTTLINTQQYIQMDDGIISFNQVPLPAEMLSGRNGLVYPIDTVLPKLNVVPSSGDHTPDEQKRPKPYSPHFGDLYPDAPLAPDMMTSTDVQSVLEGDGRFRLFLHLLDAAPQYQHLFESGGIYTLFIPTDQALEAYFEETGIAVDAFMPGDANKLIAQRTAPGYITPDYIELAAMWGGPLKLCTTYWHESVMASGEIYRDMEIIVINYDEDTGLTANGGAVSESLLYARNAVIYVTEEFHPASGRG